MMKGKTKISGDAVAKEPTPPMVFIDRLHKLREQERRGELAALRRAAGSNLGESALAIQEFYRLLPYQVNQPQQEEIYYLVATLFDLNRYEAPAKKWDTDPVNFGSTMRECKIRSERTGSTAGTDEQGESRESSIDKRFVALLDSSIESGELAYRLRQLVRLAASKEIGVNWLTLLEDLLWWNHEARYVQKRWARSYFGEQKPKEPIDISPSEEPGSE